MRPPEKWLPTVNDHRRGLNGNQEDSHGRHTGIQRCQVTVEPGDGTIELTIESSVIHQYGRQIRKVTLETLDRLGVDNAKVTIFDKGALDCTLKARVECAVYRSNGITENLPWGGVIK